MPSWNRGHAWSSNRSSNPNHHRQRRKQRSDIHHEPNGTTLPRRVCGSWGWPAYILRTEVISPLGLFGDLAKSPYSAGELILVNRRPNNTMVAGVTSWPATGMARCRDLKCSYIHVDHHQMGGLYSTKAVEPRTGWNFHHHDWCRCSWYLG